MPLSTLSAERVSQLSALIAEVAGNFSDPEWRAWAEAWLSGAERRSASAIVAAGIAGAAIEKSPTSLALAMAAFAVADAAARALIWPGEADAFIAWANKKVRTWRELAS